MIHPRGGCLSATAKVAKQRPTETIRASQRGLKLNAYWEALQTTVVISTTPPKLVKLATVKKSPGRETFWPVWAKSSMGQPLWGGDIDSMGIVVASTAVNKLNHQEIPRLTGVKQQRRE